MLLDITKLIHTYIAIFRKGNTLNIMFVIMEKFIVLSSIPLSLRAGDVLIALHTIIIVIRFTSPYTT